MGRLIRCEKIPAAAKKIALESRPSDAGFGNGGVVFVGDKFGTDLDGRPAGDGAEEPGDAEAVRISGPGPSLFRQCFKRLEGRPDRDKSPPETTNASRRQDSLLHE